jgi:Cu+-exporting ATPase
VHRTFDATETPFRPRSSAGLFALTLVVGGLLLADLLPLLLAWLPGVGIDIGVSPWPRTIGGIRWALIAAIIGTARHLLAAFDRVGEGKINSDLAVALAGLAAIALNEPLVAAEVVVIALVGECLEAITFDRAQRSLRSLGELFPIRCWVLRDGVETRVFTTELKGGDLVVVKPGGKIPCDGPIEAGASTINFASLTGESLPRDVRVGDRVLAGGINQLGTITVRAEKISTETVAGRVISLTETSLREKAPLERTADRLAAKFLPVVLALAALAFLVHFVSQWTIPIDGRRMSALAAARMAAYPALGVLVVACPCPLVLATPAAVIAALGRLAGTGVLVKGGPALERLAQVTSVAFDKTGTLTEGRLSVGEVMPFGGVGADELMTVAATAEQGSEHPIAKAILERVPQRPTADSTTAHPGGGITAILQGRRIVVGSARFLAEQGVTVGTEIEAALATIDASGQTAVLVARDGVTLGAIGCRDTVRPEAARLLTDLRGIGLTPLIMLSGDRAPAAEAVANQLDLDAVHAGLLPSEKSERLAPAMAFIGDGINDAPALAKAAVGIAVAGSGNDLAAEAGDVVLLSGQLAPLPMLVRLGRETARVIRQNIVWFGFGVNLVGVLLAGFIWPWLSLAMGWVDQSPLVGVLYHQLGSLLVLLNSMRLLAFERTPPNEPSRLKSLDAFVSRWSFDEIIHELGHRWKWVAGVLAALAVIWWGTSNVVAIRPGEVGIVRQFGAIVAEIGPGLHFRYPLGIERIDRLMPDAVRTVEVGFRPLTPGQRETLRLAKDEQQSLGGSPSAGWGSAHAEGVVRLTDEGLMLTGDGNLIELQATVRLTMADSKRVVAGPADVSPVVRSLAEIVFREQSAAERFQDLLTIDRATFELNATKRLAERVDRLLPGWRVAGVTVHDLHPPADVVNAYHAVAEAIQKRDRTINEATGDATRARKRAEEEALRIVRFAEARATQITAEAAAHRDAFLAWHRERNTLTPAELADVGNDPLRQMERLKTKRWLTEFRLSLAAATAALSQRDKVIIDGDAPGRRTIYLMDPEMFKVTPKAAPEK